MDSTTTHYPLPFHPPQAAGEIGRLGGYAVRRPLGEGGMGIVYVADDLALRRPVALKVMRPDHAAKPAARERFLREARAAAAVTHDHLVRIYQVGEDAGTPFIAMELLEGEPLSARLAAGPLPVAEAVRVGREVAAGLAAAHAAGLVHRDIKPANLFLEAPAGRVKLLDFGLARAVADPSLTDSGTVLGTPAYMAPEQAVGGAVDHRADLFSLGCVLYHAATGRRPFDGPDVMAVLHQLATHTPPPADLVNPAVPRWLAELVTQLLAKDPADRPPGAARVVTRLLTADLVARTVAATDTRAPDRKQLLLSLLHMQQETLHVAMIGKVLLYTIGIGSTLGVGWLARRLFSDTSGENSHVLSLVAGLVVVVPACWWLFRRLDRMVNRGRDRLAAEFPAETADWGGPIAYTHGGLLPKLIARVESPGFVASPSLLPPPSPPLVELLIGLKLHDREARNLGCGTVLSFYLAWYAVSLLVMVAGFEIAVAQGMLTAEVARKIKGGAWAAIVIPWIIFSPLLPGVPLLVLWRRRVEKARAELVARIVGTYPSEVSEFGGAVALADPEVVAGLVAARTTGR